MVVICGAVFVAFDFLHRSVLSRKDMGTLRANSVVTYDHLRKDIRGKGAIGRREEPRAAVAGLGGTAATAPWPVSASPAETGRLCKIERCVHGKWSSPVEGQRHARRFYAV